MYQRAAAVVLQAPEFIKSRHTVQMGYAISQEQIYPQTLLLPRRVALVRTLYQATHYPLVKNTSRINRNSYSTNSMASVRSTATNTWSGPGRKP